MSRAGGRTARTLELAVLLERFAAVLRSGGGVRAGWETAALAAPSEEAERIARIGAEGGDVGRALISAGYGPAGTAVAAGLGLSRRTGAPLATVATTLTDLLRDTADADRAREAAFAGPRATATVLQALPVVGLGLGLLLGADPVDFLLDGGLGTAVLGAGAALTVAGHGWTRRLVRTAGHRAVRARRSA